jgi:hypothetical protein
VSGPIPRADAAEDLASLPGVPEVLEWLGEVFEPGLTYRPKTGIRPSGRFCCLCSLSMARAPRSSTPVRRRPSDAVRALGRMAARPRVREQNVIRLRGG